MTPMSGPLVVQSDKTLLLEVDHPDADACRMAIAPLRRAGAGARAHPHLPPHAARAVERPGRRARRRAGRRHPAHLQPLPGAQLAAGRRGGRRGPLRPAAAGEAPRPGPGAGQHRPRRADRGAPVRAKVKGLVGARLDDDTVVVHPSERGHLKQVLLKLGWPAEDLAGYVNGEAHEIALDQDGWELRTYQKQAADSFWHGGSGVVVLPCGAGKTIVGAASMAHGPGHHVDLGHQHGVGAAVAGRAAPPDHP